MSDLRSTNAPIGADIQSDNSERLAAPPGPADVTDDTIPSNDMRGLTTHSEVDPGGKAKWVGAAVVAVALACGVAYAYEHGAFTPKQNTVVASQDLPSPSAPAQNPSSAPLPPPAPNPTNASETNGALVNPPAASPYQTDTAYQSPVQQTDTTTSATVTATAPVIDKERVDRDRKVVEDRRVEKRKTDVDHDRTRVVQHIPVQQPMTQPMTQPTDTTEVQPVPQTGNQPQATQYVAPQTNTAPQNTQNTAPQNNTGVVPQNATVVAPPQTQDSTAPVDTTRPTDNTTSPQNEQQTPQQPQTTPQQ